MKQEQTIQVWVDETDADRPYIVSRGVNGVDAPDTIAVCGTYAEAMKKAIRVADQTGLQIVDECF